MYYIDKNVEKLDRIFDQNSRKEYLRLDLNENPGGLPQDFIKKVLSCIDTRFVSEYPETLEFTQILAKYLNADISNICLVNGSAEGIRYIIQAFTESNGKILSVTPTYAMFEVYSKMYGRKFIPVSYTEDLQMPVENILERMDSSIQLLILVNPNNPMGNVYSEEDFVKILDKAKTLEITVLIDEAYHYFYDKTFIDCTLTSGGRISCFTKLMDAMEINELISTSKHNTYPLCTKATWIIRNSSNIFAGIEPILLFILNTWGHKNGKQTLEDALSALPLMGFHVRNTTTNSNDDTNGSVIDVEILNN